jgi:hypothetical protein
MRTSTAGWPVNALGSNDDGINTTGDLSSWRDCIKLMDPNGRSGLPQSERSCKILTKGRCSGSRRIRTIEQTAVSTTVVSAD